VIKVARKATLYDVIDLLTKMAISIAIAYVAGTKVAAIAFIAMILNIFGIPLLFLGLPYWVIYVVVVIWVVDIYTGLERGSK